MQTAYKVVTIFFLVLMVAGIIWVTAMEFINKKRKKDRKAGKWHPNQKK